MSIREKLSEFYGFPISRAFLPNVRGSAFKARLVANLIRGKEVTQALNILSLTPKRSAKIFEKLLRSAISNAVNNHGMDSEGLYLLKVVVNEAKTLKRHRPILRSQTAPIRKRSSHYEILLANKMSTPLPKTVELSNTGSQELVTPQESTLTTKNNQERVVLEEKNLNIAGSQETKKPKETEASAPKAKDAKLSKESQQSPKTQTTKTKKIEDK